jgi:hypothetical protein
MGSFQEGHQLDKKIVKKIPANLIGKRLSGKQAAKLLDRIS